MQLRRRKERGFTLLETLLAVLIVGIIASVAAEVLMVGLGIYKLIINRNNAFETARVGMDRMVDEIMLIDSTDISWLGDTKFGFWDIDGHSADFERHTVTQSGRTIPCIYRGDDYLAGNVIQLDFDYYRDNGSTTIWSWLVRRINIEMTVQGPYSTGNIHLRTDVFPRAFMYSNFQ